MIPPFQNHPRDSKRLIDSHAREVLCSGDNTQERAGFTLIETLVAITLLTIAIAAPIALTSKSLAAAYYARDQITAFHLAQEAIETVRHVRDRNILLTAFGAPTDLLEGILSPGESSRTFSVDTIDDSIESCSEVCDPLQIDPTGTFYGYGSEWDDSRFIRTVHVTNIVEEEGVPQEVNVAATVSWRTGAFQERSITISENLYRWVRDSTVEQ